MSNVTSITLPRIQDISMRFSLDIVTISNYCHAQSAIRDSPGGDGG
jgi:hypothetical protein